MECYICLESEGDVMTDICACKSACVHRECLKRWVLESNNIHCSICKDPFKGVRIVHRVEPFALARKRAYIYLAMTSFAGVLITTIQISFGILSHSNGISDISFVVMMAVLEAWWFGSLVSTILKPTQRRRILEFTRLDDNALRV